MDELTTEWTVASIELSHFTSVVQGVYCDGKQYLYNYVYRDGKQPVWVWPSGKALGW